ncbi:MAG: FHIPEP family type III secretion protein, partial [Planctomycetes bacterium]|nr:FHIPEP family type III secretion protein [Planctomycetota bacterium]
MIFVIIFIPLPTFIMDMLLMMSVSFSLLIMITITYLKQPLDFSVFPSVLLISTVFRLGLNIATTRLILGNSPKSEAPAGYVIQAFGEFVGGSSVVIGIVIFLIITIIQFVVITKGANRISEVAARFTLDAMPGKQMSIDADLNAGLITEDDARKRREKIMREADFYGAMDGATKFVRGDAIAGIIITVINVLGGFIIGWLKYDLTIKESLATYTILTIGDGLVSQIPALIISLAAGLLVTRSTATTELGTEFLGQLFKEKKAILITGVFLLTLMITPLPSAPLLA